MPFTLQTLVQWDCLMSMSHEYHCEDVGGKYSIIYSITPESKTKMSPTVGNSRISLICSMNPACALAWAEENRLPFWPLVIAIPCWNNANSMYTCPPHIISHKLFHSFPISFRSSNTMCCCYIMGLGMRRPNLALKSECASFSTQVEGKPPQSFSH